MALRRVQAAGRPVLSRTAPRELSVVHLLEWAFGAECARLPGSDEMDRLRGERPGIGTEYRLMQRRMIGCQIDGGGRSEPHPDAEAVAEEVAGLPLALGGLSMAFRIAELARAGLRPNAMVDARPRVLPELWNENQHGGRAGKVWVRDLGLEGPHYAERRGRKGNVVREKVMVCPVVITPTAAQIGAARRAYLAWYGAVLHLRGALAAPGVLSCHRLTQAMPPVTPWLRGVDK